MAPRGAAGAMMGRQAIVLAAIGLLAAACGRTPFPVMETQLDDLKGQPATAVFAKLGAPNDTQTIAGERVYSWLSDHIRSLSGDAAGMIDFQCAIRVFADKNDKVSHYDFTGNVGGCARYAHRLDNSYDLVDWSTP